MADLKPLIAPLIKQNLRFLTIFFLLALEPCMGVAETEEPERFLAPILKLDSKPPVDLSAAQRLDLKQNPRRNAWEVQRNILRSKERTISWLGILAILGATALLLWPKKREKLVAKTAPPQDPRKVALTNLEAVRKTQNSADQFYVQLTTIIKEYLEQVYHVKAKTKTSEEFFKEMVNYSFLDGESCRSLTAFLKIADEVKFGHYQPSEKEREWAIEAARKVLQ